MSSKYILDSSAWIEYLGGSIKGTQVAKLLETRAIGTSIIAIAELADKFEREDRNFEKTLTFIQGKSLILPFTLSIACSAAKIKKEMRAKRNKFGLVDAIHLATAFQQKAIFVTADNDFRDIKNVLLLEQISIR